MFSRYYYCKLYVGSYSCTNTKKLYVCLYIAFVLHSNKSTSTVKYTETQQKTVVF